MHFKVFWNKRHPSIGGYRHHSTKRRLLKTAIIFHLWWSCQMQFRITKITWQFWHWINFLCLSLMLEKKTHMWRKFKIYICLQFNQVQHLYSEGSRWHFPIFPLSTQVGEWQETFLHWSHKVPPIYNTINYQYLRLPYLLVTIVCTVLRQITYGPSYYMKLKLSGK